jgi:predicted dehydrogenase
VIRIGLLGAARIARRALLLPATQTPNVQVTAVAARDPRRARALAARYGIARAHDSYADLIADPEIDAVYIPLPNSLHALWTIRALKVGKHVLCEKPFAANAGEAEQMAEAATAAGKVLMEAFHYRYHPLLAQMLEIIQGGELGAVRHIEAAMCIPMIRPWDIRLRYDLAGGATMDVGCYTVHLLRTLAGDEPEVVCARALLHSPQVDRAMSAELRFADGRTGRITCSLRSATLLKLNARVEGDQGVLLVTNPFLPHLYHRLTLQTPTGTRHERVAGDSTYACQLRAFVAAVEEGTPVLTGPADAVANLRVVDAIYRAAGLSLRGT